MARLPDRIEISPQRAAQLALGSTYQGDFGLDEVSAGFMRARAGVQERAKLEAKEAAAARDSGYQEQYAQNVQLADRPDFSMNQVQTWKALHDEHAQGLSPDARLYYDRQGLDDQLQAQNRASAAQMARAEDKRRTQEAYANHALMADAGVNAMVQLNPLKEDLTDNFTGEHPGLVEDFRAKAKPLRDAAVAAARPEDQGAVGAAYDTRIAEYAGDLTRKEDERIDAFRFGKVNENVNVMEAAVRKHPDSLWIAEGLVDGTLAPLGAGLAKEARRGVISRLHGAYLDSFVNKDDPEGGLAAMNKGNLKLTDEAEKHYRNLFTTAVNSEAHEVSELRNKQALNADIVAIETTGVGTGFSPDSFRKPLDREIAHQQQVEAAKTFQLVKRVPTMTDADYATYRASILPKVGANGLNPPDYDLQMHRVEVADKMRADAAVALRKDPASLIYQDPAMKPLISTRGTSVSANEAYFQAQHDTQLHREGMTEEGWHGLRAAEAHDYAQRTKGPPANWLNGMIDVQSAARGHGRFEGQFIRDLESLGGLDPTDAAVLKVGMSRPGIEAYVIGRAAATTDKMPVSDQTDLRNAAQRELRQLSQSLADSGAEGRLLADQLVTAAAFAARGEMKNGKSRDEAAKIGASWILNRYQFSTNGLRVPRWKVPDTVEVSVPAKGSLIIGGAAGPGGDPGGAMMAQMQGAAPTAPTITGANAIALAGAKDVQDIADSQGAGLWAKPFAGATDDKQRRRLYAEEIRVGGVWVAKADDSGWVLTTPNPTMGPPLPVLDINRRPYFRTAEQMLEIAKRPPKKK